MPSVPVNYLAIILAAASSLVTGTFWYGPLFGKIWIKEMGFTKADMAAATKKGMAKSYILMFAGSLVMSCVLAYLHQPSFLVWLGFIVPTQLSEVLFGTKSFRLYLIHIGYWLVNLLVMGTILTLL